ncbi:MAG: hypothetical protein NVSMB49_26450 [Ktedonobacteraceae bacterium]
MTTIHYSKAVSQNVEGGLRLGFIYDQDIKQTRMIMCEQQQPLQVIRAFPIANGGALVHMHNISGGVLGGDTLHVAADIGPKAYVQLTSTSATRLYRCALDVPIAVQTSEIQVQEAALLEYLPDPLIPFAGSRYKQQTRITLEADAVLFWWETVAPGRTAMGEIFNYELLQTEFALSAQGRPIAIERLKLEPHRRSLSSLARLASYYYFCSFYICRVGLEAARWLSLEGELRELAQKLTRPTEISWGVSTLVADGLVVRALGRQGRDISSGLLTFWRAAKMALFGQEAIPPRKSY